MSDPIADEAARLRAQAADHIAEAERLDAEASRRRAIAAKLIEAADAAEGSGLHLRSEHATNLRMSLVQSTQPKTKKRRGPPLTSTGPAATAAKKAGISMAELARRLGVPYTTLASWDHRGRVLDEKIAEKLRRAPYV